MSTSPPDPTSAEPFASQPGARIAADLRTPRAAAIAGIAFALVLAAVVVLLHNAIPDSGARSDWITDSSRRRQVSWALELVPYAGIAFLWFIGVIRSRLGDREDRFFATVFLGSGLLFIAMLFTAAALIGALLIVYDSSPTVPMDEVQLVGQTSIVLLSTFSIRMAAVFTLAVTSLGRRTRIVPGWLQAVGVLTALLLLFAPPRSVWAVLLFPAWVLLISVQILIASWRPGGVPDAGALSPPP
jgi:hypothetical protein